MPADLVLQSLPQDASPGTIVLAAEGLAGVMETYILESPVLGALAVLLVGLLAAEALRRTGRARPGLYALGTALLLGAGIILVGSRIETPRERVTAATRAMVEAVVSADEAAARSMLADRVAFRTDGRPDFSLDRDWMLSVTRGMGGVFKSHSLEIRDVVVSNNDTVAQARFFSRAIFRDQAVAFVPSVWEFTWRLDTAANVWRLHGIECLSIYGKPASGEWITWGNRHRK